LPDVPGKPLLPTAQNVKETELTVNWQRPAAAGGGVVAEDLAILQVFTINPPTAAVVAGGGELASVTRAFLFHAIA